MSETSMPNSPPSSAPSSAPVSARQEALIAALSSGLRATSRLPAPALRAALWLCVVVLLGVGLAQISDLAAMWQRLAGAPDMWLAATGSALTAIGAALAAFQTSVPGRSRLWSLLPVPPLLLWLAASGVGCLRAWVVPGAHDPSLFEERTCLVFILAMSLPLSLLLALMLRRAPPLRPGLTAGLAGLAAAAAAASLLNLFHPYDAALSDLLVHGLAVGIVVAANRLLAR